MAAERYVEGMQAITLADEPGVIACISGLEPAGWPTRFVLGGWTPGDAGIAHLAAPGLALPSDPA